MSDIVVSHQVALRSEIGRFISQVEEGGQAALREMTNMIAGFAVGYAPRRSGRLAASISGIVRGNTGFAFADAPYARAQEKGARPHVIANREGPQDVLANEEQNFFSAHAVMHPGNPAAHFLTRAGQQVAAMTPAIMKRYMPGV